MNIELLVSLGLSVGVLALAFMYRSASKEAARASTYKSAAEAVAEHARKLATDDAAKEEYIREIEKTVYSSLSSAELAARLNKLFAHRGSRAPSTVPIAVRATSTTGTKLD